MKELSIEEKGRRYDEAIERANNIREGKCKNVFVYNHYNQRLIEYLFTELKENEDEKIRKELIDYFSASHATDTFRGIPWDRVVGWLEKQDEQKPAWSEEDEACYISIIEHLKHSITNGKPETYTSGRLTDWIDNRVKSLRPQNHWKPSEEQMKALKEAVDEHFDIDGGALWHLYENLKKLRGE